jgi:hypothetical protein
MIMKVRVNRGHLQISEIHRLEQCCHLYNYIQISLRLASSFEEMYFDGNVWIA